MSRPLRIAMFVGTFPVISETFILRQITGLIDLGHHVDIYSDSRADPGPPIQPEVTQYRLLDRTTFMDMPSETAPAEIPVWPITGRTWPPGSTKSISNFARVCRAVPKFARCIVTQPRLTRSVLRKVEYGYQAASLSALYRLAKLSEQRRTYDVLHAHFGPVGKSFGFASQLWGAPLVVTFHGYDFTTLPRKQGADMYQRLFATVDALTVNSDYTRQSIEKLGAPSAKIHRLPVGLDPAEFPFRERTLKPGERIRILSVGRLVAIKGHEYSIRAVAQLCGQYPSLAYDIVGDGPLRPQLQKLIAELRMESNVLLRGAQGGSEVKRMMGEAHIFMLNSVNIEGDQEGQGLVLQEAQASGLPVIATEHGAFPEGLVVGKSGFLVPERDVNALAGRLAWLIEHPETWATMGFIGRKFVEENYDIRKLNTRLNEIYSTVIENYPHA